MDAVAALVPITGRIVDLGCGLGVLSMLLAIRSAERQVLGIDIDAERIRAARGVTADIPNLRFEVRDLLEPVDAADAVLLIDVLHYFNPNAQQEILDRIRQALVPGGLLICREAVRESHPRFWWNWLHERIMLGLRITKAAGHSTNFPRLEELTSRFSQSRFTVQRIERLRTWLPYSDRLIVAIAS